MTSQLRTTAPRDCHCSAQLRPPLKGLPSRATACRYVYTGPGGVFSLATDPPGTPVAPCKIRSFTYIQMVHTHAPPRRGRWNENESEMTMKMKWTIPNQDAKRGTQKKRDRENTNTTHLARNGQTLKRQGKRKAEADGQRNKTSGGGGRTEAPEPT